MFEIIGFLVVAYVGWSVIKLILYRVFPGYGYKVASRRFQEDPSESNNRLLWEARRRLNKSK